MKKYQAVIIGSGQAGTPLAFKLAAEGLSVAFIEREHWGGTCLNEGCTPTKTDRILGAAILGTGGDEIISSVLNIMTADQPYTVIRDSVHLHPTVSELIPTMLESVKPVS